MSDPVASETPVPAKQPSLINRAGVKKFILLKIKALKPSAKITRVSKEALERVEGNLRAFVDTMINDSAVSGKTFKP